MKRTILRVLVAVMAFTAGLTASGIINAFSPVDVTPKVVELKTFDGPQLAAPEPPPPLPIPASTPKPTVILDYEVERFFPEGAYEISGKVPKGFKEFGSFWIERDYLDQSTGNVGVSIYKDEYENHTRNALFVLVTEKRLVFVTPPFDDGTEYRFDGQFIRGQNLSEYPEGTAVLQGTLTRSRNGRTIAETTVKFKMVFDHC